MTNPALPPARPSAHPSPRPSPSGTPEALLARYRATGEPEALGALFDGTAPVLFRMALSLTTDAAVAEDCVQETYLAALESLERFDATKAVMPWLVGILQIMVRRSRRERTRVPDPIRVAAAHPGEVGDDAAIDVEHDEEAREIRGAIDSLDEPYRSVALLRWRYGLSPAEIADVRDEPPGTVRSLLSRALERMRKALKATPALAILPIAPLGLAAVREAVIRRGVELGIGAAASAAGASVGVGFAFLAAHKASVAAVTLLAVGGGLLAWRPWAAGGGASDAGAPVQVAPANVGPAPSPASAAPAVAPETPVPAAPDAPPPPPVVPEPELSAPAHPEAETPTAPPVEPDPSTDPQLGVDPAMGAPAGAPAAPAPVPAPPIVVNPDDPEDEGIAGALGDRIEAAVTKGVRWLKQHQLPDGSWGLIEGTAAYGGGATTGAYKHPAGSTALALYALLKSGESLDDPAVKRGFRYLRERQKLPGGSYETSMMLLAVTATADPYHRTRESEAAGEKVKFPSGDWRDWAQRLQAQLVAKRAKAKTLGWRYQVDAVETTPGGNEDLSSTQLAALALLAAERCGIRTESSVWNDMITFALKQQETDGPAWPRAVYDRRPKGASPAPGESGRYAPPAGAAAPKDRARGFAYIRSDTLSPDEGKPTGGMTACGIGVLQMARYVLAKREDRTYAARDQRAIQAAIYDGLAWLDANWSPFANPGKKSENVYHVYYVYCVERSLDLIGNVLLGKHPWFAEMAQELVARQTERGFWDSDSTHKPQEVLDTAFALLFLRRSMNGVIHGSVTEPGDAPPEERRGK